MKREYQFRNVFGNWYVAELLPREQVEKILDEIDLDDVASEAIDSYVKGWTLDVDLNPETGKLMYSTRTGGGGSIATHYIPIAVIKNLDLDVDTIYWSEQYGFFGYDREMDWHDRQKIAESHEDWHDACVEQVAAWLDQAFSELEDQRREVLNRIYANPVR